MLLHNFKYLGLALHQPIKLICSILGGYGVKVDNAETDPKMYIPMPLSEFGPENKPKTGVSNTS